MRLKCKIQSIDAIARTVYRVRLSPEENCSFKAGQYLMVVMDENDKRPFSIASTPMESEHIELHVGVPEGNFYTLAVIERLQQEQEILVELPFGDAWLREDTDRPLLLIAGGTGFAYVKSILLTVLLKQPERAVVLYWGVREVCYFYDLEQLKLLEASHPNLKIILVLEQPPAEQSDSNESNKASRCRKGSVISAVLQDYSAIRAQYSISIKQVAHNSENMAYPTSTQQLAGHDIYIAGPFEMARIAHEYFCADFGAQKDHLFSDAFSFV